MPKSILDKLQILFEKLKFDSTQKSFVETILTKLLAKGKINVSNISISQTEENELLIYTDKTNFYKNIIIDKECDIELLKISKDSRQIESKLFFLEDDFSLDDVISEFNDF
jgi:hypothetical protein